MTSNPGDQPSLDHEARTGRVFVVHLRADADAAHGEVRGRIQHVRSSDAAHFENLEELAAFITDCVRREQR